MYRMNRELGKNDGQQKEYKWLLNRIQFDNWEHSIPEIVFRESSESFVRYYASCCSFLLNLNSSIWVKTPIQRK